MRSGPTTTRTALLAGAAALAVCASGCDSGTGSAAAEPTTAPTTAPTAVATTAATTAAATSPSSPLPTSPAGGPAGGTATGPARCRTGDVTVTVGPVSAAASGRSATLILTARPGRRCTVAGFGGLQLLDRSRAPLPTTLRRTADPHPPVPIGGPQDPPVLAKKLSWSVVPTGAGGDPRTRCPSPVYAKVTLPDETTSLVLRWTLPVVCDGDLVGGPWAPGSG